MKSQNTQLEFYLVALDRALGGLPLSERSEIVTQTKSKILALLEKDKSLALSSVLANLGAPETVAKEYLTGRGLKPMKTSNGSGLKWLAIGFLGFVLIVCVSIGLLIWKMTPLLKIDENTQRVTLLGGLIDLDQQSGGVSFGGINWEEATNHEMEGERVIDPAQIEKLDVVFTNGKVRLAGQSGNKLGWDCKTRLPDPLAIVQETGKTLLFNFSTAAFTKCDFRLPRGLKVFVRGANGKVDLKDPQANTTVDIGNGTVSVTPDKNLKYKYDTSVGNGTVDVFESSDSNEAIQLKITVSNGKIKK